MVAQYAQVKLRTARTLDATTSSGLACCSRSDTSKIERRPRSTIGPEADVTLTCDAVEQAMIYQALMKAIAGRPYLIGLYPFNYAYAPAPNAPNYSVTGKPAEAVLSAWYAHALP